MGFYGADGNINYCFLSSDGKSIVATEGGRRDAHIWDVNSGRRSIISSTQAAITAAAHSRQDDMLILGDAEGSLYACSMAKEVKAAQIEWKAHPNKVHAIAASSDGTIIASGDAQGEVCLWADKTRLRSIKAHTGPVLALALSPSHARVLSAGKTTEGVLELILWDTKSGSEVRRFIPSFP
jgi:WD40 repeat protein